MSSIHARRGLKVNFGKLCLDTHSSSSTLFSQLSHHSWLKYEVLALSPSSPYRRQEKSPKSPLSFRPILPNLNTLSTVSMPSVCGGLSGTLQALYLSLGLSNGIVYLHSCCTHQPLPLDHEVLEVLDPLVGLLAEDVVTLGQLGHLLLQR